MPDAAAAGHQLTDRLDLNEISLADLSAIHRLTADPRNREYIPGGAHDSVATTRAWLERFRLGWEANAVGYWTVRLRATGEVIGIGGVDRRAGFWNLYYLLDRTHWGRGYATELARAAQQTAGSLDPELPLVAWIHADNIASQRVASHIGLRDYGRLEPEHWKGAPMHYWANREPS
jgi:RimJ/RimL family protein N-acetyltransferase